MGRHQGDGPFLWAKYLMRSHEISEIRAPKENVSEVAAANATYGFVGKAGRVALVSLNGSVDLLQTSEKTRVQQLMRDISSPEGYFERIIIDGLGNVVEGQHRFEAVKALGWSVVPVKQIIDVADHVKREVVARVAATGHSEDRAWQVVRNVAENVYEDDDIEGDYDHMGSWSTAFNTALEGIRAEGGLLNLLRVF